MMDDDIEWRRAGSKVGGEMAMTAPAAAGPAAAPAADWAELEAEARAHPVGYHRVVERGEVIPRFMTAGLHHTDVMTTLARVGDDDAWIVEWSRTAAEHEAAARQALERGRRLTAGQAFYRAALAYHFAQYMHFQDLAAKWQAQARTQACYRAGMAAFVPPAEAVEVPYEATTLPGYLRVLPGRAAAPCLVILGGADSTKQEYHHLENHFLQRGVATLSVDGPGQGEAWPRVKMRPDWNTATSAVLDYLATRPEVDAARAGVLGLSFGGHLAVLAAAADHRFAAAVWLGGFYDTAHYDWTQPTRRIRFPYLCGTRDLATAQRIACEFTLAGRIERVRAPLLVVHGRQDPVSPVEHAERVVREAPGPTELVVFEDGNHVCHNIPWKAHPLIADWVAETLRAEPAGGPAVS
jgi:2,6-dihydroxypseudooxynicotine hydrolase